jgi:hypothetical protein
VVGCDEGGLESELWCGGVWCGVVWCGVVWFGVVWCGVVWCGVVWCAVLCCAVGGGEVVCGVVPYLCDNDGLLIFYTHADKTLRKRKLPGWSAGSPPLARYYLFSLCFFVFLICYFCWLRGGAS